MAWIAKELVPSMYHRRLLLLAGLVALALGLLACQMARLTVAQGAQWRAKAEASLLQRRLIPTVRGEILDRRGRVLAQDKASFDVTVRYPVISGRWAYQTARTLARRAAGASWYALAPGERDHLVAQQQVRVEAQVEALWQALCEAGGIDRAELEQRKATIGRRVQSVVSEVQLRRLERRSAELDEPVTLADVAQPVAEQLAAHPLLSDLEDRGRLLVQRMLTQARAADLKQNPELAVWRQVALEPSKHRDYPLETMHVVIDRGTFPSPLRHAAPLEMTVSGVALHLVGQMREVWAQDRGPAERPFRRQDADGRDLVDLGGYLPGDRIGRWGIEATQEAVLRGRRGQIVEYLDTQSQSRTEPVPGRNVTLSIDAQLQARVQALMDPALGLLSAQTWHRHHGENEPDTAVQAGQRLCGAAVVLDVASGQVLAAVSAPGFSLARLQLNPGEVWRDAENAPYVFRPVAVPYEPGSTVKPLVLAAAISRKVVAPGAVIHCGGHLYPHNTGQFRCWIYRQYHSAHGDLTGSDAIARSCNIYFYTLGRDLGGPGLVDWYGRFGLGRPLLGVGADAELSEEVAGELPRMGGGPGRTPDAEALTRDQATLMGIGQGPMRWTVLQAANAYATLGRGGTFVRPTFIAAIDGHPTPVQARDIGLDPRGVEEALRGLEDAVGKSYGTCHQIGSLGREPIFNLPGVKVYGKSGTADAPPRRVDSDGDGRITGRDQIVRTGPHAWFVGLAQRPGSARPDYAIAVVVEHAGSGGIVAGPIANQILHALRAEGWL